MEYRERGDWLNWCIPAGALSGVKVGIHWTFPLFLLTYSLFEGARHGATWGWTLVIVFAALFVLVLAHEFGHVFAGRREGIDAERVMLWPLGGLAFLGEEAEGGAEIRIAAAGPAVNLAAAILFLPILALAGLRMDADILNPFFWWPAAADGGPASFGQHLLYSIHKVNLVCLLFNLIPAFPMDGGRILRGALHGRLGRIRSTIAVTTIALFVAGGFLVWAVLKSKLLLAFVAVFVALEAFTTRRRTMAEAAELGAGGFAGYDFSMGRTSLEASLREARKAEREEEKERKRREKEVERERETEARVDELLDKISREGMDSLTRRERAFLERASRRKP